MFVKWKTEYFDEKDSKLLLGASLGLSLLFVLLYFNYQETGSEGQNKRVGTVFVKRNLVQRKPDTKVIWKTVQQSYPVYEQDIVRTASESAAVLYLDGKFVIDMDENTLILLDFFTSSPKGRVRLEKGSARFRRLISEGQQTLDLEVVDKDQTFTLQGTGELFLSKTEDNDKLQIAVFNAQLDLRSDKGIEESLLPNHLFLLSSSGEKITKQKLAILPLEPQDGAYVAGVVKSIAVAFTWKLEEAQAQKVQIEISKSRDFSNPLLRKRSVKSPFTANLKPGLYYWRLRAPPDKGTNARSIQSTTEEGAYSIARKLRVISQAAVQTHSPLEGSIFTYYDSPAFVNFSWRPDPLAAIYLLEVTRVGDTEFKKPLLKKRTLFPKYGTNFRKGKYHWRVTVQNALTGAHFASKSKSFQVIRDKEGSSDLAFNIDPDQVLSREILAKKGILLSWKDRVEVARTEITIADNPELSRPIVSAKVSRNFYRIVKNLPKQRYYYKAKFYNKQKKLIFSSATRVFRVQNIKIKLSALEPGDKASFHNEDIVKEGINFTWSRKPKPKAKEGQLKFRLLVARDSTFKKVVFRRETKQVSLQSKAVKRKGTYFWKVLALDPESKEAFAQTKTFSFTIRQLPLLHIEGLGKIRGYISGRIGDLVEISCREGTIITDINKVLNAKHEY